MERRGGETTRCACTGMACWKMECGRAVRSPSLESDGVRNRQNEGGRQQAENLEGAAACVPLPHPPTDELGLNLYLQACSRSMCDFARTSDRCLAPQYYAYLALTTNFSVRCLLTTSCDPVHLALFVGDINARHLTAPPCQGGIGPGGVFCQTTKLLFHS